MRGRHQTVLLARQHRDMKIAVVTETYPPEVNGVALTLSRAVRGLRERGHTVRLVRPHQPGVDEAGDAGADDELLTAGMRIPGYAHLRMGRPGWAPDRAMRGAWQNWRPDVVHIATEGPLGWMALNAAQAMGLPVTSDFRTNFHSYSQHYGLGLLMRPIAQYLRHFHNRTLCTMVPTAVLRDELHGRGFERLQVVARGVDANLFDPRKRCAELRRSWGVGEDDAVVLHVGRLAPEKNLSALLLAYQAMRVERPGTRLVLVGDGPLRASLQASCPSAIFAGVRRGEELARCYASADFFVFPSVTETFGNVTPEAMASGLPVLAFRHAAAGQLIQNGVHGCVVTVGDEPGFVDQARGLVRQREQARALGLAARQSAEQLDWSHVIDRIETVMLWASLQAGQDRAFMAPLRAQL
jgi:glycosyltransferase involved in cell wall biosynthesis